jgi:serine/threonine protein kinase
MTSDRWQQIEQLYYAAVERDAAERAAFLDEACGGDEALRQEVESLLASHEQAGEFLASPALEVAAKLVAEDHVGSAVGHSIGHYQILSLLGAGGMGEVYLAQDVKLGRKVALKLLPAGFTQDEDRVRRFRQEARAASALNHPNIITIYEIGEARGTHFIATEFIDGQTLRQQMAKTRIGVSQALDVAIQVASALSAAHQAGIVHRDVKPENIMLRPDGYVKVLDFGLAKPTDRQSLTVTPEAPTIATVKTNPGLVMGTTNYMSPESARGLQVDARADIFSLGVVLYEMIAGRAPFEGATTSDVIASLLATEPAPLRQHSPEVPLELEGIVTRTLAKDREERYQTVEEVLTDLRQLKHRLELEAEPERSIQPEWSGPGAVEVAKKSAARTAEIRPARPTSSAEIIISEIKRHKKGVGIALAASFAFGLYSFIGWDQPTNQPAAPFQKLEFTRLTATRTAWSPAISPDGKYVVYVVIEAGRQSLWLRQVTTASNQRILPPAEVSYYGLPIFSHDGKHIYYTRSEKNDPVRVLYRMPALGGPSKKLIVDVLGYVTLSPDDTQVAFVRWDSSRGESALIVANADGTGEQKLATRPLSDPFRTPAWSPDGKVIACATGHQGLRDTRLVKVRLDDGTEFPIASRSWANIREVAWLSDGSGLVMIARYQPGSQSQIWHLSYPGGEARRITHDPVNYVGISLTADSSTLVTSQTEHIGNIWIAPDGDASRAKPIATAWFGRFSWTPDGKILYTSFASGNADIGIMTADGTGQKQLTADTGTNIDPTASPDGRYIVFASDRTGASHIWRMDSDGSNPVQLTNGNGENGPRCSPDGQWVVYTSVRDWTLWKVPIDGGGPVQLTDGNSAGADVSPDGKWIAYWLWDGKPSRPYKIAVIPFEGGLPVKIFDIPQTFSSLTVRWTADGQALTYVVDREGVSNIWSQPLGGGPLKPLTDFQSDQIFAFDWSHDGQQLAVTRGVWASDVVLMRHFR